MECQSGLDQPLPADIVSLRLPKECARTYLTIVANAPAIDLVVCCQSNSVVNAGAHLGGVAQGNQDRSIDFGGVLI